MVGGWTPRRHGAYFRVGSAEARGEWAGARVPVMSRPVQGRDGAKPDATPRDSGSAGGEAAVRWSSMTDTVAEPKIRCYYIVYDWRNGTAWTASWRVHNTTHDLDTAAGVIAYIKELNAYHGTADLIVKSWKELRP